MPPTETVDSFRGRGGDIVAIVMATTKEIGPGLTTNKQRLNVMITCQRSGLVIFGDLNVAGVLWTGKDKDKGKGKGKIVMAEYSAGGSSLFNVNMLYNLLTAIRDMDRVAVVTHEPDQSGP